MSYYIKKVYYMNGRKPSETLSRYIGGQLISDCKVINILINVNFYC